MRKVEMSPFYLRRLTLHYPITVGSKFTKLDLEGVTDYIEFESLCHALMSREGYKDIQPLRGQQDKGRDAIHHDKSTGTDTIFSYSVREDWNNKLDEDLKKITTHNHLCDRVVFVTTGCPTTPEKERKQSRVKQQQGWDLEFYDLGRIEASHFFPRGRVVF